MCKFWSLDCGGEGVRFLGERYRFLLFPLPLMLPWAEGDFGRKPRTLTWFAREFCVVPQLIIKWSFPFPPAVVPGVYKCLRNLLRSRGYWALSEFSGHNNI